MNAYSDGSGTSEDGRWRLLGSLELTPGFRYEIYNGLFLMINAFY